MCSNIKRIIPEDFLLQCNSIGKSASVADFHYPVGGTLGTALCTRSDRVLLFPFSNISLCPSIALLSKRYVQAI